MTFNIKDTDFCRILDGRHFQEGIDPQELHEVYGINCYHHALRDRNVYMVVQSPGTESKPGAVVKYVYLSPGHPGTLSPIFRSRSAQDFRQRTLAGCADDGLVDLGMQSPLVNGGHVIAVYFKQADKRADPFDYHFIRAEEDGKWSWKWPMNQPQQADYVPGQIQGSYVFDRFFLVPEGTLAKKHEQLDFEEVFMGGARYSVHVPKSEESREYWANCESFEGQSFLFNSWTGEAFYLDGLQKTAILVAYPLLGPPLVPDLVSIPKGP